jgi:hypothetical protein
MGAQLGWQVRRDSDGAVAMTPPLRTDAAMLGVAVREAGAQAARLHGLCPLAHRTATCAALGEAIDPLQLRAVGVETAFACALRLGVHWPAALGLKPLPQTAVALQAARMGDTRQLKIGLEALAIAAAPMAQMLAHDLDDMPDPDDLSQPLSNRFARAIAQAVSFAERLPMPALTAEPGAARLSTLRGDLIVRASHAEGVITRFFSSAPTDRLFAAQGPVARVCAIAKSAAQARRAVLALDPCGGVEIIFARELADA